ncbi:Uncharacterised protein [Klebsiella variicola]|nr:Uncharacterised protein [Klebsiella variicola]
MGTVNAHPAGGGDVVEHNAAVRQPLNGLRRILHEATQQLRVVFVVAALQGFLIEQLFTVLNTFDPLEASFRGVHPGGSLDGVAANGRHFFDDQDAGAFVVSLNGCRQAGAAAADHHHVITFRRGVIAALFRCQRFAGFQHRFSDRFFHRFALAGSTGNGVHVRGVGGQNTFADLFEAGGELDGLHRARRQFNIGNMIIFEANVDHQFIGVILNGFNKHPRLKFSVAHAHVADHRFHQREAPQRFRNMQRLALGAVDKQLQLFTGGDTSRPVRIGDAGAAHGDQVITVIEAQLGISNVNHPADAHHRHLSQGFRAHRAVFLDQRCWIAGIDDRRTQGRAHREVQIIDTAGSQLFQQIHGVVEADPRDLHLFRREAIADDKGIVSVLAGHFVGDVEDRQRETGAIVAATAPLVVALVGVR